MYPAAVACPCLNLHLSRDGSRPRKPLHCLDEVTFIVVHEGDGDAVLGHFTGWSRHGTAGALDPTHECGQIARDETEDHLVARRAGDPVEVEQDEATRTRSIGFEDNFGDLAIGDLTLDATVLFETEDCRVEAGARL